MNNTPEIRDGMIHQAQQQRIVKDTLILQKVNKVQREAFKSRFPGQLEHIMRLTAERLQAILANKPEDLSNPETWMATAQEVRDLSEALFYLAQISKENPIEE